MPSRRGRYLEEDDRKQEPQGERSRRRLNRSREEDANQLQNRLPDDLRALVLGYYVPDAIVTTRDDRVERGVVTVSTPHGRTGVLVRRLSRYVRSQQSARAAVGHGGYQYHQHAFDVSKL
jgi:hypothetical protein